MRHAEAGPASGPGGDVERPLTERGMADAARIGRFLRSHDLLPTFALCSPALRARQTLDALALGPEIPVSHDNSLYSAGADGLLGALAAAPDSHERLLLIGHNPSIQALALALAGRSTRATAIKREFGPATLAVFDARVEAWRGLGPDHATLRQSVFARDLADA